MKETHVLPSRFLPLRVLVWSMVLLALLLITGCTVIPVSPGGTPLAPLPVTPPAPAPVGRTWPQIQEAGSLHVGTSADYPPFAYYDEAFRLTGFDPTLIREIGERLGLEVRMTDMPFNGLFDSLQVGQIDAAIGAIAVTTEREQQADFTNIYFISEDAFLARADAAFNVLGSMEDVEEQALVGVQEGSVYATWAERELVERGVLPAANLMLYGDISRAVKDLELGRIDLVILDAVAAERLQETGSVKIVARGLNRQRYAIAVPIGADELRRNLNAALEQLRDEGRITELAVEYMGLEEPQPLPTFAPTALPTGTATPLPIPTLQPTATQTPVSPPTRCVDGSAWVADLSFDDQNMKAPPVLQPGQAFVKSWRLLNSGACTWDDRYRLTFVGGNVAGARMSGQATYVSGRVESGQTYDMSIAMIAPYTPGTYQGYWQMYNDLNQPFGQRIWVGIRVPSPTTATPTPTPTPSSSIYFVASRTSIRQGESVTFTWQVRGVREVYFYREGQNWWNHGVSGESSRTEYPDRTISYFLRVVRTDGSVEIREIRIYVTPSPNAPDIRLFSVVPEWQVTLGQCVQITWEVQGEISSLDILRNGVTLWGGAPARSSLQDCPPATGRYEYQLRARGPGGDSVAVRAIDVASPTQPTSTPTPTPTPILPATPTPTPTSVPPANVQQFIVSPNQIQAGQCAGITWVVVGDPAMVQISRDMQLLFDNAPLTGTAQDCPAMPGTYIYRIEVVNRVGQISDFREVALVVVDAPATATPTFTPTETPTAGPSTPTDTPTPAPEGPVINFFAVTPDVVALGECVTIQWGYTGTDLAATSLTRGDEKLLGDPPPSGDYNDCPPGPGEYFYRLSLFPNAGGSVEEVRTVIVNP